MVTAAFAALSRATRANYSFIQQGVREGLSSAQINTALRAQTGQGIRRQDLLAGMRLAGGVQREGRNIANVGLTRRPSYEGFPTFSPITSDKRYLIQYEVRTRDSITGETGTRYITVGTDERLTRAELDQAARDAYAAGQREARYGRNFLMETVVPIGARQQVF